MVGKKQPVTCVETGKVYSGQRECSRDLCVTVTAVNHVLMGRCEKVRGFTIRLATGDEIFEWQKSQPKRLDREGWKALALELGEGLRDAMRYNLDEDPGLKKMLGETLDRLEGVI